MVDTLKRINEDDGLGQAPWYVKVGIRIGIPVALSVALVIVIVNLFVGDVKDAVGQTRATQAALADHIKLDTAEAIDARASRQRTEQYLRVICLSIAQPEYRSNCLSTQ